EPAPLLLGFVLGPMMEEYLRRALLLSKGDATVLLTRPISLTMLLMAAGLLMLVMLPAFSKTREVAFQEEGV
ncbi:MAG: tripartite tricarboxylate transporter permease, partial [Hyphomicrobium sp.]